MEMNEVVWESIEPEFSIQVIDPEYEFDAPQFFDFTLPESYLDAQEAECWFQTAGNYPPSPFIVKLNWSVENANTVQKYKDGESKNSVCSDSDISMDTEVPELDENSREIYSQCQMTRAIPKVRAKSLVKSSLSSNSTLMKPTASHLAKQNQLREGYSWKYRGRSQKPLVKIDEKRPQNSSIVESQATKRQKLESGYLLKAAHLKHYTILAHKATKKVDINSACVRPKVTIPREPTLETANRAQRQRFKKNAHSSEHMKLDAHQFKALPLNRKILDAPSLPLPKKSTPQLPEFQVFNLETSERALLHTLNNVVNTSNTLSISQNEIMKCKRSNSSDALKQEKCETVHNYKARPLSRKELTFPTNKWFSRNLPIELFSKLSLTSDVGPDTASRPKSSVLSKGSKENAPVSFHQELVMTNGVEGKPQKSGRTPSQCGSGKMIPDFGPSFNINRSLDIR